MARPTVTFNDGSMRKVGDMLGQAMMYPGGGAAGAMEAGTSKAITNGAGEAEQLAATAGSPGNANPAVQRVARTPNPVGLPLPGQSMEMEDMDAAPADSAEVPSVTTRPDAAALSPSPFLNAAAAPPRTAGGLLNFLSFIRNKLPNFGPFNRQQQSQYDPELEAARQRLRQRREYFDSL